MFEKEAEEYALGWREKTDGTYACCRDGYLAGAEFGYNKANEWHYVKDGDLPKYDVLADDVSITVLNQNGNKVFYNFLEKVWKLETSNKISNVIAWKEIVLPELKESE